MASGERRQSQNPNAALRPTWRGHVNTTMDALILFEACLNGDLLHCARRPHDREREDLIRSGNVFIYEEHSSGIKRWTDGYNWSPSRILNNFLIYRELEKAFPPGEKKKALKKKNSMSKNGVIKLEASSRSNSIGSATAMSAMGSGSEDAAQNNADRALIGSLVDSYPFKEKGLVKKTISINLSGVPHHLVSYYNIDDVKNGRLATPHNDPALTISVAMPRAQLITGQNFRVAVDHEEQTFNPSDGSWVQQFQGHHYTMSARAAQMGVPDWGSHRSMSVPSIHPSLNFHAQNQYHMSQQALGQPFDTQHQNGYYQVPAHQTAQEYALSTNNFHSRQHFAPMPNGLPELLNSQRRNTVQVAHTGLEGTEFALPAALSMSAAEPRAFSNNTTPFLHPTTTISMAPTGLLSVSPLEADMFHTNTQAALIASGPSTGQVTPTMTESHENLHLGGEDRSAWAAFDDSFPQDAFHLGGASAWADHGHDDGTNGDGTHGANVTSGLGH